MPREIRAVLDQIVEYAFRDFVQPWYGELYGPDAAMEEKVRAPGALEAGWCGC